MSPPGAAKTSADHPVRRVLDSRAGRGVLRVAERLPGGRDRLVVLTYHRITDVVDDGRYPGLVSATPEELRDHVRTIVDELVPVSIDDVIAALDGRATLPARAVLLTFDDAVRDFHDHALPVLHEAGVPAVVFAPTGFVGRPDRVFWWDALHAAIATTDRADPLATPVGSVSFVPEGRRDAYRRLRDHCLELPATEATDLALELCTRLGVTPPPAEVMGWDELRTLEQHGVRVCPHTRTHPHLDQLTATEVHAEVAGSLTDLRAELGDVAPAFAYPAGRITREVAEATAGAGIRAAFTTRRGTNRVGSADPMALSRINVSRRFGISAVRAQALPLAQPLWAAR